MPWEYRLENVTVVEQWLSKLPRFSRAQRAAHWSSLLPCTTLPPPVGGGTFSLHWRFPSILLLLIVTPPVFWNAWRLPPIRDLSRTTTLRAFSACTLPITRMPRALNAASPSTFTVPFTKVPLSLHVAPSGTRRLSTVVAPIVPLHTVSSAQTGSAGRRSAQPRISRPSRLVARFTFASSLRAWTLPAVRERSVRGE